MRAEMVSYSIQAKSGRAEWTWRGLMPGTYRLTVACPGIDEPIVAIDGIVVTEGSTVDSRLQGVDLRGRVRVLNIRAIGADDEPIADRDGFVVVRSSQEGGEWFGFHLGTGLAEIVTSGAADLLVLVPGYRMVEVSGVSTDRDIALEPAPIARLRLKLGKAIPEGFEMSLLLEPRLELPRRSRITLNNGRGMGLSGFFRETVRFDAAGEAEVPARFEVPCEVSAWLGKSGARGRRVSRVEPREVRLGSALITVLVPTAGIERALQRRYPE